MPWSTGKAFAAAHNKKLHGAAADKAKDMANAMLRAGVPEGIAIATANKHADKMLSHSRASGGGLHVHMPKAHMPHISLPHVAGAPSAPTIGGHGFKPMTPAQGTPFFARKEAREIGRPGGAFADGGQAVARALSVARRQMGGMLGESMGAAMPWMERAEAAQMDRSGFIAGPGGGRHDKNDMSLPSGSYIEPADVVAGLGDGNSLHGARVFDLILNSMPYGVAEQRLPHRQMPPPRPPSDPELAAGMREGERAPGFAEGGAPPVEVVTADGEYRISDTDCMRIGARYLPPNKAPTRQNLIRHGHAVLDAFNKEVRGRTIRKLRSLPGPVHSKEPSKGHV